MKIILEKKESKKKNKFIKDNIKQHDKWNDGEGGKYVSVFQHNYINRFFKTTVKCIIAASYRHSI